MTEHATEHVTEHPVDHASPTAPVLPTHASIWTVVKAQRKTLGVALALAVASFWIIGQLGMWRLATCLAIGVGLGVLNHLATEYWLLRIVAGGHQPSRGSMIRATMVRLVVLTVAAVVLAVLLWPDGVGLLLGLAIFRLIALMMTSLSVLRDLKEEARSQ